MAAAVATPTITSLDFTGRKVIARGTIAIGASPLTYPAAGIVCSFAGLSDLENTSVPDEVIVFSAPAAGVSPSGYVYLFCPGTTQANGQLCIFTGAAAQSALAELSAGNIPAGVSGDVIHFVATFPRL